MFSDLQFQYPLAFWLLLLVPFFLLLFLFNLWWKRKAVRRIGDVKLVRALFPGYSPFKNILKASLILIAFALGCIALANPRKPDRNSGEARSGIDIVIALDVSNSMKATDVAPDRLSKELSMSTLLGEQATIEVRIKTARETRMAQ